MSVSSLSVNCVRRNAARSRVDLHRRFVSGFGDDFARERGLSGTDFDDRVAGFGVDRAHDATDPVTVVEEVLSEAFAGVMPLKPFLFHG